MKRYLRWPGKKRKAPIPQSDSTETNTESSALPPEESSVICSLHRTCKTISLAAFIEVYCNSDFSFLIISGVPTKEQLIEAWQEIVFEWSSILKNEESAYLFELKKRIGSLEAEIVYVDFVAPLLKTQRKFRQIDAELIEELNKFGYIVSNPPEDDELDMAVSLCKTKVFEHEEMVEEYNRLNATVTGKKQTEDDFNKTIAQLSQFVHYRIDKKQTTMDEFGGIFNLYLHELDYLTKKHGSAAN